MPTLLERLTAATITVENAATKEDEILAGGIGDFVTTAFGPIRTIANAINVMSAFNPTGAWLTATSYSTKDLADESGVIYICIIPHTSGVFATDFAAGKWQIHQITTGIIPVGFPGWWLGPVTSLPAGWLVRNGQNISRVTYASLFAVTHTRYGIGNGSTTFALPDDRGLPIRGLDQGAGVDPATDERTSPFASFNLTGDTVISTAIISNITTTNLFAGMTITGTGIPADTKIITVGGSTITLDTNATATNAAVTLTFELLGDEVGTAQDDALGSHNHTRRVERDLFAGTSAVYRRRGEKIFDSSGQTTNENTGGVGGPENRMKNRAYIPIIKF